MKKRLLFVERKFTGFFSLEKVFRQIAKNLPGDKLETQFQAATFRSSLTGIFRNLFSFRPQPADIYHVTGDITYLALLLPPEKTIVTIPDLSILQYRTGLRRMVLKKILFDWPIGRANYITAISDATRDNVIEQTGCPPEKVRTIELPVDENFSCADKPPFNAECPNLLQMGALPYKNVPNLIKAIEGLRCRLTIIGKLDEATITLLKDSNIDYVNESQLNDDAVKEHYRKADIVVFCSVYEGFGLPIIEGQAMNTPVVTSDLSPMKDVAGDGALLVDPYKPAEIRAAIDSIVRDESLRRSLVERGAANVQRFRPEAIAKRYEALYDEILNRS